MERAYRASVAQEPAPPGPRRRQLRNGFLQAMGDPGRDGSVQGVMTEQFLDAAKLANGLLLLLIGGKLCLLLRGEFDLAFHLDLRRFSGTGRRKLCGRDATCREWHRRFDS